MGETDFNRFMRLNNQLVIAPEHFGRGENLSTVLISTLSEDMDEQSKLTHKVTDEVDQANRKVFVTLMPFNVEKTREFLCSLRLFAKKTEEMKFQQTVYMIYTLEVFIYLLDVMDSVHDKVNTNKPNCNVI